MTDPTQALKPLRDRIDSIDLALLALLRQRIAIIEEVRAIKGKQQVYIRPGREAAMLRVLLQQPQGLLPKGFVHRLWREMIGAFTLAEGTMRAALPGDEPGFWDLARDHFGSFMPMHPVADAAAALHAVITGAVELAALPLPRQNTPAWWRLLLAEPSLNLFYRFPFDGRRGNARPCPQDGMVIGAVAPEATGDDASVVLIEWQHGVTPAYIATALASLAPSQQLLSQEPGQLLLSWLILPGFKPDLTAWHTAHAPHIHRQRLLGCYPCPITPETA